MLSVGMQTIKFLSLMLNSVNFLAPIFNSINFLTQILIDIFIKNMYNINVLNNCQIKCRALGLQKFQGGAVVVYEEKKRKLEQKLTDACKSNDVKAIVVLREKLIKLCKDYAASIYPKFTIKYEFALMNGIVRLNADIREDKSSKLSSQEVFEIITKGRRKTEYNDDYLYEYSDGANQDNSDYPNAADFCDF